MLIKFQNYQKKFSIIASSQNSKFAIVENKDKKILWSTISS